MLIVRMQGEWDAFLPNPTTVTQAQYEANVRSELATFRAAGVTSPIFVGVETWVNGGLPPNSAAIRAGQMGVVDNVDLFAGPDFDSLDNSWRTSASTHFTATGADKVASMWLATIASWLASH